MNKDENYTFKIKSVDKNNVNEYSVCADDNFINDNGVGINKLKEQEGYKVIEIANNINLKDFKTYYKIGKNSDWIEGETKFGILDYDLTRSQLVNDDNTITISAKIENTSTHEVVNFSKNFNVNTSFAENEIEADSLISAMDTNDLKTGIYIINVNDESYNLKVYSFDEDLEINTDIEFGTEEDVANKDEYAKNMVVLKVNGDLTIDENSKVTSYASKDGFGGTKGMMVYCSGTLTNNGTISMTARGAKAEGQNVYLWKNSDSSYEYVPAVGAKGGESVGGTSTYSGLAGSDGKDRQTGGGGSGACYTGLGGRAYSGAGAYGTSYSGGTGGAAWIGYWNGKTEDGQPNRRIWRKK